MDTVFGHVDLEYLRLWFQAFVFTQVVEVPIWMAGLSGSRLRRFAIGFGASALTHPLVWYVIPGLMEPNWLAGRVLSLAGPGALVNDDGSFTYSTYLVIAELYAWLFEAAYARGLGLKRAVLWSLLANGGSLGLGELTRYLWGWP
jgi:hypothetical protein